MIKKSAKAAHRSLFYLNFQNLKIERSLTARQRSLDLTF